MDAVPSWMGQGDGQRSDSFPLAETGRWARRRDGGVQPGAGGAAPLLRCSPGRGPVGRGTGRYANGVRQRPRRAEGPRRGLPAGAEDTEAALFQPPRSAGAAAMPAVTARPPCPRPLLR